MPGRIRLFCVRCGWVDPLADDDVTFELATICLRCTREMLEDRRVGARRQLNHIGPWVFEVRRAARARPP